MELLVTERSGQELVWRLRFFAAEDVAKIKELRGRR